jgi:hypothetical protein
MDSLGECPDELSHSKWLSERTYGARKHGHLSWIALGIAVALFPSLARANTGDKLWSATFYMGPSTHQFATDILKGYYNVSGAMLGLALDRRVATLAQGLTLEVEGQVTQFVFGHPYTTASIGLGIRFSNFPWRETLPTSVAVYTGPSYATNPPPSGYLRDQPLFFTGTRWLNYVGFEVAVALPRSDGWEGAFRLFHRSGVFGLYTLQDDQGTAMGLGLRKSF